MGHRHVSPLQRDHPNMQLPLEPRFVPEAMTGRKGSPRRIAQMNALGVRIAAAIRAARHRLY
jgi:hypothetical protein